MTKFIRMQFKTLCLFAFIVCGVLLVSSLPIPSFSRDVTITQGVADISFLEDGIRYHLDGQWNLSLEGNESKLIQVPSVAWNKGSGIYSLILQWDGEPSEFELYTTNAGTSYELWVNGVNVGGSGLYGTSSEQSIPSARPEVLSFLLQTGENQLQIKVSNFVHPRAGLWERVYIARKPTLLKWYQGRIALQYFIFGQLFLFFILQMALAFYSGKKDEHVWFALGTLFVAIGNLMRNDLAIYVLFPSMEYLLFKQIQIVSYYLASGFFIYAFRNRFPSTVFSVLSQLFCVFCLVISVLTFLLSYDLVYWWAISFFPSMFFLLQFRVFKQLFRDQSLFVFSKEGVVLQVVADICLSYGMAHDFVSIATARYDMQMIPLMTYMYVGLHTLVLAKKYILTDIQTEEAKTQIILNTSYQKQQLANDLHDGIGQYLHALDFMTEGLLQENNSNTKVLSMIRETSKLTLQQLAHIVDDLNPVRFGSATLAQALHRLAERNQSIYKIETSCIVEGVDLRFDGLLTQNLYYVYSEAVKNAVSHAKPKYIIIQLEVLEAAIEGSVENDGVSPSSNLTAPSGHGLAIMNYRIEMLGGVFEIFKKGKDTVIMQFRIPRRFNNDQSHARG